MARAMTIGGLAKAAAVNVETIRYYQRLGLIDEPRRPLGGQRSYPLTTVGKLAFIRRAQQLGFTLAEIRELLRLAGSNSRAAVRRIAQSRYSKLALQADQLIAMSKRLKSLLDKSQRRHGRGADPIVAALRGEEPLPS